MLDDLRARGVKFHSLTEAIDTATPTGRAMWRMIGVLAELEKVAHLRTHPRRSEGRAAQRRQVWPEAQTHVAADRPRPQTDRQRRSPPVRGRPLKCWPLDAIPCAYAIRGREREEKESSSDTAGKVVGVQAQIRKDCEALRHRAARQGERF